MLYAPMDGEPSPRFFFSSAPRTVSRPAYVPPQWIPSGVMLTEWTTFAEVRKFEVGRESMAGSATVIAVSDDECEFRFNNYWSASDVGWPKELDLAGSLHIEPDSVLRVRIWTTKRVLSLAKVVWGVPAIGCLITGLTGLVSGSWDGFGTCLFTVCAASVVVKQSISGAKRFGEDAVRSANILATGV